MKHFKLFIFLLAMVVAVGLCVSNTVMAEGKPGGTLIVSAGQVPRHFNGAVQSGAATALASTQIFASPLRYDDKWNPQPYLAESWKISEDGLTVTLNLVKNATFHDGKPVTSEDVAFSITTIKQNHPFKTMFAPVEKIETPDAHTAVLKLSQPHPAILLAMSPPLCPIIPKHVFGDGQDIKKHPMNLKPIGSGPFKFAEYKTSEHLILVRNENFFIEGRPYLDRLVYRYIPDPVGRVMAAEAQETHIEATVISARDIKRLQKQDHLKVEFSAPAIGPINWLAFNLKNEYLSDKRVRQAICYAVDREFIVKRMHFGLSQEATGPIVPGSPFYSSEVEHYALNLEKANKLLDEAGFPKTDGKRFSLTVDSMPFLPEQQKNIAEYLKPQLKKVGIEVVVRASPDFPTWAKRVATWDFDMTLDNVWNWGDPVIGVHRTYLSDNIRQGVIWSNTQNYSNPKVDEILAKAAVEGDPAKRKALYAEFQKIVVDDAPIFYSNVLPTHIAYHKNLRNVNNTIWGGLSPNDEMYWEKPPAK
jgi:peptide/nickel transport system substrate-binding protein